MQRRRVLELIGGFGLGAGAARAIDNTLLGYGAVTGTNLREQDLDPLMTDGLEPREWEYAVDGSRFSLADGALTVSGPDGETTLDPVDASREAVRAAEDLHDVPGEPVAEVIADLDAIAADEIRFSFHTPEDFFDRVAGSRTRPYTTDALRGRGVRSVDPEVVREFTGADPASPRSVVEGLVEGFRRHAHYDVPRYAAGAITYNVLFEAADPRDHFEEPVDFASLLHSNDETGMFCNEFADRSIEALHSVPAPEQSIPVVAGYVSDWRHKHVYTVIASALRQGDAEGEATGTPGAELEMAATFVDYTHTTLYDDFRLTGLLGEGLNAYNDRHYADRIAWLRY